MHGTPMGNALLLLSCCLLCCSACNKIEETYGPTIDAFVGQLTREGKPITIPEGERVVLRVTQLETGRIFGILIKNDGTFDVGWMPIGRYSLVLERPQADDGRGIKMPINQIPLSDPLEIVEGQTEYTIELGEAWKPTKAAQ